MLPLSDTPILGQQRVLASLERLLASRPTSAALLFVGPPRVGKTTLMSAVASALLGVPQSSFLRHPDFHLLTRTRQKNGGIKELIGVGEVRRLKERLMLSTSCANHHVVWIPELDRLSISAANALLKLLEEPPIPTFFLARSRSRSTILPTILSRCLTYELASVASQEIHDHLVHTHQIPKDIAQTYVAYARGSPGRAIRFAKNPELMDRWKERVTLIRTLESAPLHHKLTSLNATLPKPPAERRRFANTLLDTWDVDLLNTLEAEQNQSRRQALASHLKAHLSARTLLRQMVHPQLVLESLLL